MTPQQEQAAASDAAALTAEAQGGRWDKFTAALDRLLHRKVAAAVDECAQKHLQRGGDGTSMNDQEKAALITAAKDEAQKALGPVVQEAVKAALAPVADELKALKSMNDERIKAEKAAGDAALRLQAEKVAKLRVGTDAAKVKIEADRLVTFGKPALDELEAVLSQPGVVDPTLLLGPVNVDDPFGVSREDGATYVRDWSKIPLPAQPFAKGVGK